MKFRNFQTLSFQKRNRVGLNLYNSLWKTSIMKKYSVIESYKCLQQLVRSHGMDTGSEYKH